MKTINRSYECQTVVSGSKFILYFEPVSTRVQFSTRLSELKQLHPGANHVCSAFRIIGTKNPQPELGFDDDGEPNGSAGKPILAPLLGNDLINVAAYVVRYFGGVKLGVGGLVRAYGGILSDCIKGIDLDLYISKTRFRLSCDYTHNDLFKYFLKTNNITVLNTDYSEKVEIEIEMSEEERSKLSSTIDSHLFEIQEV